MYIQYNTNLNGTAWGFKYIRYPKDFNDECGCYFVHEAEPKMLKGIAMPYNKEKKCYEGEYIGVDVDDRRLLFQWVDKAI